jgi:glutamine synthetase
MGTSEARAALRKLHAEDVVLQFTDISGGLHSLWVPAQLVPEVAEDGIHMDGSSVDMVDIGRSDLKLVPDLGTLTLLPSGLFRSRVARMVCDVFEPDSDEPFEGDPRRVLRRVIDDSRKVLGANATYNACSEIEYFLFSRDQSGSLKGRTRAGTSRPRPPTWASTRGSR